MQKISSSSSNVNLTPPPKTSVTTQPQWSLKNPGVGNLFAAETVTTPSTQSSSMGSSYSLQSQIGHSIQYTTPQKKLANRSILRTPPASLKFIVLHNSTKHLKTMEKTPPSILRTTPASLKKSACVDGSPTTYHTSKQSPSPSNKSVSSYEDTVPLKKEETQPFFQSPSQPKRNNTPCALTTEYLETHKKSILPIAGKQIEFIHGGKHKKFNPQYGLLRTNSSKIAQEFEKEQAILSLIEAIESTEVRANLTLHTSFQCQLSSDEVKCLGLEEKDSLGNIYFYAKVTIYDETVYSKELDEILSKENSHKTLSQKEKDVVELSELSSKKNKPKLSQHQVVEISKQIIEISKNFYLANIQHNDLHMHNILIHIHGEKILVKAIDFGKAMCPKDESSRNDDLNYIFFKESRYFIETFRRNILRNQSGSAQAKHYPLHRLAEYLGIPAKKVDEFITKQGIILVNKLKHATNPTEITAAFDSCNKQICQWLSNFQASQTSTKNDMSPTTKVMIQMYRRVGPSR